MSSANHPNRVVSASRVINASPAEIFDILADPAQHHVIDGSDTVIAARGGNPDPAQHGGPFRHGHEDGPPLPDHQRGGGVRGEPPHRLAPFRPPHLALPAGTGGGSTKVTESFDWCQSRFPPVYEWVGYPAKHEVNMARTLERLDAHLTGGLRTEGTGSGPSSSPAVIWPGRRSDGDHAQPGQLGLVDQRLVAHDDGADGGVPQPAVAGLDGGPRVGRVAAQGDDPRRPLDLGLEAGPVAAGQEAAGSG